MRKDVLGQMVVDAPPGQHDLTLAFVTPLENRIGRIATVVTILALIGLFALSVRQERQA